MFSHRLHRLLLRPNDPPKARHELDRAARDLQSSQAQHLRSEHSLRYCANLDILFFREATGYLYHVAIRRAGQTNAFVDPVFQVWQRFRSMGREYQPFGSVPRPRKTRRDTMYDENEEEVFGEG